MELFTADPKPFYNVANTFLREFDVNPVKAHKFIKLLHDRDQLLMNYTQNIDGLELKAGLPLDKLTQAHGHMREAYCHQCKKDYPIDLYKDHVDRQEVLYCDECQGGIVKPSIVFFGEALPSSFFQSFRLIEEADLVIVMGTSLKVYPFAFLLSDSILPGHVPIVMINRENPGIVRDNFLFLQGNIEDHIGSICEELGLEL